MIWPLMLTSKHKAAMAEKDAGSFRVECQAAEALTEIEHLKAELRAADNLASGWEAKFEKVVVGSEKDAREINRLRALVECRDAEIADLRPDAQKWRDSLKRSRDRKAAKKNPPARDKRAKRGGGK